MNGWRKNSPALGAHRTDSLNDSDKPDLAAEDEDLQVISASADAVAKVQDLVWLPRAGRFAALFNRFKWEEAERKNGKGDNVRVRAGLYFDHVRS